MSEQPTDKKKPMPFDDAMQFVRVAAMGMLNIAERNLYETMGREVAITILVSVNPHPDAFDPSGRRCNTLSVSNIEHDEVKKMMLEYINGSTPEDEEVQHARPD